MRRKGTEMYCFTCKEDFESMMTCIYRVWEAKKGSQNVRLEIEPVEQMDLLTEYVHVEVDPELAQEWNAARNTRKPTEISRLSQYPVWWKGICGHEWKDKVFHRAVEGAGCIYCEKAFLKELPYLLVTMYAKQYGLATRTDDEKLIGARIDAVIPELRLAFAFSQKGTDREAKVAEVLHFLCKAKRIQLFVIRQKDPIALATEIKQAFAKANLFINSDSQRDVAHLRKRYFAQKNDGN